MNLVLFLLFCGALVIFNRLDIRPLPDARVFLLGLACIVIAIVAERFCFHHVKNVVEHQDDLMRLPVQDRGRVMQAGCITMINIAAFFLFGLLLVIIQAVLFFKSR